MGKELWLKEDMCEERGREWKVGYGCRICEEEFIQTSNGFSGPIPTFLICSIVGGVFQLGRHFSFPARNFSVVVFVGIIASLLRLLVLRYRCYHSSQE